MHNFSVYLVPKIPRLIHFNQPLVHAEESPVDVEKSLLEKPLFLLNLCVTERKTMAKKSSDGHEKNNVEFTLVLYKTSFSLALGVNLAGVSEPEKRKRIVWKHTLHIKLG